jgi:hypothetical protein
VASQQQAAAEMFAIGLNRIATSGYYGDRGKEIDSEIQVAQAVHDGPSTPGRCNNGSSREPSGSLARPSWIRCPRCHRGRLST